MMMHMRSLYLPTDVSVILVGGVTPNITTTSPLIDDDSYVMYKVDQDDFQHYVFSLVTYHQASDDDEAPMTKRQFKALNGKLDSLLESSKSPSN